MCVSFRVTNVEADLLVVSLVSLVSSVEFFVYLYPEEGRMC